MRVGKQPPSLLFAIAFGISVGLLARVLFPLLEKPVPTMSEFENFARLVIGAALVCGGLSYLLANSVLRKSLPYRAHWNIVGRSAVFTALLVALAELSPSLPSLGLAPVASIALAAVAIAFSGAVLSIARANGTVRIAAVVLLVLVLVPQLAAVYWSWRDQSLLR